MSEIVTKLMEIAGVGFEVARHTLDICHNDLIKAINYHVDTIGNDAVPSEFDDDDNGGGVGGSNGTRRAINSTEAALPMDNKIVTIDSDEDEINVRAPDPRTKETMIDAANDNFRMRQRQFPAQNLEPLRNFQLEGEIQEACLENGENSGPPRKRPRLEDLFRPPIDLLFNGDLQAAREYAKLNNRWLIINIQDHNLFESQTLNRDIWSNVNIRAIVKRLFVFWQVGIDNVEGSRCKVFYKVTEMPHVSIIDPRTGENRLTFDTEAKKSTEKFMKNLQDFIAENEVLVAALESSTSSTSSAKHQTNSNNEQHERLQKQKPTDQTEPSTSLTSSSSSTTKTKEYINETSIAASSPSTLKRFKTTQPTTSHNIIETIVIDDTDDDDDDNDGDGDAFDNINHQLLEEDLNYISCGEVSDEDDDDDDDDDDGSDGIVQEKRVLTDGNGDHNNIDEIQDRTKPNEPYENYLGSAQDEKSTIILRLPNGEKDILHWPQSTVIKALKLYVIEIYPQYTTIKPYRLLSSYPTQDLNQLADDVTLQQANLHPSATVYFHLDD